MCCERPSQNIGVYKITNIKNNKLYIGSSINIRKRWREHRKDLNNNIHHSVYLQRSWNRHGSDSFVFEIIELVNNKKLVISREQFWLDNLKPFERDRGYNMYNVANSPLGYKHSQETRLKLSIARKGKQCKEKNHMYGKKHSETTKAQMRLSHIYRGRAVNADQVREIRNRYNDGESIQSIANNFGLSHGGVSHIVHNRSWKDLI